MPTSEDYWLTRPRLGNASKFPSRRWPSGLARAKAHATPFLVGIAATNWPMSWLGRTRNSPLVLCDDHPQNNDREEQGKGVCGARSTPQAWRKPAYP